MLLYRRHLGIPHPGGVPRPWVWILVVLRHRLADGLLRRREEATGDHRSHNRPQDRRDPEQPELRERPAIARHRVRARERLTWKNGQALPPEGKHSSVAFSADRRHIGPAPLDSSSLPGRACRSHRSDPCSSCRRPLRPDWPQG